MQQTAPGTHRNRLLPNKGPLRNRMLLPYLLLLVVALAWSSYWVIAKNRIADTLADWTAAQSAQGRTLDCGTRSLGGYPFRFEFRCTGLSWTDAPGGVSLTANEARAVALAYKPWHIIFEADAPGSFSDAKGLAMNADWTSLRASIELWGALPSAIALVAEEPHINGFAPAVIVPPVSAQSLSLHLRPVEAGAAGDYQYAFRLDGLAEPQAGQTWTISADGEIKQGSALALSGDPRIWQANGGGIALERAAITDGASSISGTGEIAPNETGQWSGQVLVNVSAKPPSDPSAQPSYMQALFVAVSAGAEFFGRDETIDGKSVRAVDLIINDGKLNLGGLSLGELPRLF